MIVVTILQTGYVRTADDGSSRANGTVTLIRQYASDESRAAFSPLFTVLVDTGSPFDGPRLSQKLEALGVDVDVVVGTHGHVDHVGNLNLLAQSGRTVFYLGGDKLIPQDAYESIQFDQETEVALPSMTGQDRKVTLTDAAPLRRPEIGDDSILDHLFLLKTPGHTESDLSVAVISEELELTCIDCYVQTDPSLVSTCNTCLGFRSRRRRCRG